MAEIREVDEKGELVVKEQPVLKTTAEVLDIPTLDPLEVATHQVLGLETDSEKSRYDSKIKDIVN
mgnify:CR=1 FL=1